MTKWVITNQRYISVLAVLLIPVFYIVVRVRRNKELEEKDIGAIFSLALSGALVSEGLLLILCAFDPAALPSVESYPGYLAISALCTLVIAGIIIRKYFKEM